jgi:hypothetical protein
LKIFYAQRSKIIGRYCCNRMGLLRTLPGRRWTS